MSTRYTRHDLAEHVTRAGIQDGRAYFVEDRGECYPYRYTVAEIRTYDSDECAKCGAPAWHHTPDRAEYGEQITDHPAEPIPRGQTYAGGLDRFSKRPTDALAMFEQRQRRTAGAGHPLTYADLAASGHYLADEARRILEDYDQTDGHRHQMHARRVESSTGQAWRRCRVAGCELEREDTR